ncbi:putative membrane protein [Andreprevotia lacus DSM 23236]|uniref:Putative membrane protein n=1 Tax=Andreprevotia lacus DSM 23236 TaxID=1121001 RepID=A0A1W1XGR0_9NEIS|nr:DUF2214 family protein [Andreprevotia lacus]SMC23173.1 putative membrane protein [Andreprevotia lacus DSM 23236]
MIQDAILAAAHYLCILLLVTFLAIETALVKREWMPLAAAKLVRYDALYGLMAVLVLTTGLLRVFLGAKGAAFYEHNPVFHAKVTLFIAIGLLSIWPTLRFRAWGKAAKADPAYAPPEVELRKVRRVVMVEVHLLALLPILAAFMARGIGMQG